MKFDLHIHSHYSDGSLSPKEVVEECRKANLGIISLTDHESVSGIPEAMEAGAESNIRVIPGAEFAVDFMNRERHILGYFLDWQNSDLGEFFKRWEVTRVKQAEQIISKLQGLGFSITLEEAIVQTRGTLGRSHICWAVFANKSNAAALDYWKVSDKDDFFKKFLLDKPYGEGLAYAPREKPPAKIVIELIQDLGGMAFLAHPYWKVKDPGEVEIVVPALHDLGLDGLETFYFIYGRKQTAALHELARRFSLYESGGSDFHGHHTKKSGKVGGFNDFGMEPNLPW